MGSSPIRVAIFVYDAKCVQIAAKLHASIAQLVEQGTENPRVSGSIPLRATTKHSEGCANFFGNCGIEKEAAKFQLVRNFYKK